MRREDLYAAVASQRAARWEYVNTLDVDELARFIDREACDENLRADVDNVLAALAAFGDDVAIRMIVSGKVER